MCCCCYNVNAPPRVEQSPHQTKPNPTPPYHDDRWPVALTHVDPLQPVSDWSVLVMCPQKQTSDWKPEMLLPSGSEYVLLTELRWDTEYEVLVVAENEKGKSQPGSFFFRTAAEPSAIPGFPSLNILILTVWMLAPVLITCTKLTDHTATEHMHSTHTKHTLNSQLTPLLNKYTKPNAHTKHFQKTQSSSRY